jgi:hypothetical protein
MGKVAKAVGNAVKSTVKAVGNAVSSGARAVEKAVVSTAKAVDKYVVEPIKRDPITAIATAVGYYYGGALGAGAANAASNKAQGRSWGDSIKSGAITWATAAATQKAADYFKAPSQGVGAPVQEGLRGPTTSQIANVADDFATPQTTDSILKQAAKESAQSATGYKPGISTTPTPSVSLATPSVSVPSTPSYSQLLAEQFDDPLMLPQKGAQPTITPAPTTYNTPFTSASVADDVANVADDVGRGVYRQVDDVAAAQGPGTGQFTDVADDISSFGRQPSGIDYQAGKPPVLDYPRPSSGVGIPKSSTFASAIGDYVWDGVKWVYNNPLYALAGYSLINQYLNKPKPPGADGSADDSYEQNKENQGFDTSLGDINPTQADLYAMKRGRRGYEGDIYSYGEKGGEHEFFTPVTYVPIAEAQSYQPEQYAMGGAVGALNAANPSYYRYGAIPQGYADGGYTAGGAKADGRADNIPAMLSHGEYVIDAETVGLLGNGSSDAGAAKLDQMRKNVRQQKGKALAKGKFSPNAMSPLAYIKQRG